MFQDVSISAVWIALFALVISAGSFFLEIRRWFESGVKLKLTYMADAIEIVKGGDSPDLNTRYIIFTVSNRGDTPTTLTHFELVYYPPFWGKLFNESPQHFYVPEPSDTQPLPRFLEPGSGWTGRAIRNKDINSMLEEGRLWACIHANHSDKPSKVRIRQPKKPKGKELS